MKTVKYTLETGQEIELTPEDIKALKLIVDAAFANLDDTVYKKLKASTPVEIKEALAAMSDEDLLQFARMNEPHRRNGYKPDPFSLKIYQELFKRNGYGYKQVSHLSFKQERFLKSLGLRTK
ncbi:hypothetical protein EG346_16985 [Chryseobacterium carnipullorum]|uniref:Uncharacterized protein n=1 Tax=Chryseobacterium carnipullorum TaxID=1124835 RepID=A0A376DUC5_CHRCU|nr:hypothetical protein [Chryseobacterium carnipullorum]AZA49770.1 hypothetical protein EG346_16985 [Chryseobacterium carnipullorum]AZA64662.1 hypothetical protein EG345_08015 [Chryseobacterium carnipullorum]STC95664.1 Uncharacterised protein [Chryseobacterium carnipullorum]